MDLSKSSSDGNLCSKSSTVGTCWLVCCDLNLAGLGGGAGLFFLGVLVEEVGLTRCRLLFRLAFLMAMNRASMLDDMSWFISPQAGNHHHYPHPFEYQLLYLAWNTPT